MFYIKASLINTSLFKSYINLEDLKRCKITAPIFPQNIKLFIYLPLFSALGADVTFGKPVNLCK